MSKVQSYLVEKLEESIGDSESTTNSSLYWLNELKKELDKD